MPENKEILDLYRKIKLLGTDLVFRMSDLTMTNIEAQDLLEKFVLIEETIRSLKQEEEKER